MGEPSDVVLLDGKRKGDQFKAPQTTQLDFRLENKSVALDGKRNEHMMFHGTLPFSPCLSRCLLSPTVCQIHTVFVLAWWSWSIPTSVRMSGPALSAFMSGPALSAFMSSKTLRQ
jgi:hypothetical protein